MTDAQSTFQAPTRARLDFEGSSATKRQIYWAAGFCFFLAIVVVAGGTLATGAGPRNTPLVPIASTVWSFAGLLTAFLLLAQFYVTGRLAFGFFSVAYAVSALMTWPYLVLFPGVFGAHPLAPGMQQVAIYLWIIWHLTFPLLAVVAVFSDAAYGHIVSRRKIKVATIWFSAFSALGTVAIVALVVGFRFALPQLVIDGRFQPLCQTVLFPVAIGVNLIAFVALLWKRALSALSLWLAVAMFSELADLLLNLLSPARYSYAWDIGKLITVTSASIVLIMMLFSIAGLYGRLAKSAKTDMLTRLANRRAFEEHFQMVFQNARRLHQSMGLLVVDIDFFKGYNDSHGHLAGDDCLRQVAHALALSATRPLDLVSRYGGEEFVVVLPHTPIHGVLVVAERIRAAVERLDLVHCDETLGRVTVSIGAGHVLDALTSDESALFEAADRALYAAKGAGRNRVLAGGQPPPQCAVEQAPVMSTIAVTSVAQVVAATQVASAQQ